MEDHHNNLLITILELALNYAITDWIYARVKLPVHHQDWKRKAIDIGGMLQRRNAVHPPRTIYMAPKPPEHRPPPCPNPAPISNLNAMQVNHIATCGNCYN